MDEPDPISALTELNEATAAYRQAEEDVQKAFERRGTTLAKLDEVQKQFDALYNQLRKSAPDESYWGDNPF